MSGSSSARKGANGERELAAVLREYGYNIERGGSMSFGEIPDLTGLPGIHVEVKRRERLNVPEAMKQARRDKGIASADYYDLSKSTERSMRQQIDTLFNAPVCEAVFGADPIFALSGGCPLWFNLLEGIIHTLSVPPTTECRRIMKRYAAKRR